MKVIGQLLHVALRGLERHQRELGRPLTVIHRRASEGTQRAFEAAEKASESAERDSKEPGRATEVAGSL